MAHRASATAWSDTVLLFSRDLLSCRMVDLAREPDEQSLVSVITQDTQVWFHDNPPSENVTFPDRSGTIGLLRGKRPCPRAGAGQGGSESPGAAAGSQVIGS